MPINLVITNAGRAALVNATNTGTLPITITQIGLSSVYTAPVQTLTALPSELKRLSAIAGQVVADDCLHVSVKDQSADAYALRSIALYLGNGTLFACAGQSDPMLNKASSAVALAAFDIAFDDIDAASISFGDTDFMMPTATTEAPGVVELATVAEAQAGIDALRALTPASAKAAVLGWILSQDGSGSGMDADLLDGQHGSWYADVVSRLGFTPVNKSGDTITNVIGFNNPDNAGIAARPNGDTPLKVGGNGVGPAIQTFHRPGSHAIFFGLDIDNKLKLGGWSLGAGAWELWHAGNDGSGSGLDADVLDGQHGSFYTDIAARLGYTPLNAVAYTAPDVINKLLTVDGAGSGLDADLVDGWHRDDIRRWGNLLDKPFNWSGQSGQPSWVWGANDSGAYYVWNPSNFSVNYANSAGNADTLDGEHASAFLRTADFTGANQSLGVNGFQELPGGLILQWGGGSSPNNGIAYVPFSSPFPNYCIGAWVNAGKNDSGAQDNYPTAMAWSQAGFTVTNAVESLEMRWFALGF